MSKIDPELKKKLLKETQTPFKSLRKILWIAFTGSAYLGLLIMISNFATGNGFQLNNFFIQIGACVLFPFLLFIDRGLFIFPIIVAFYFEIDPRMIILLSLFLLAFFILITPFRLGVCLAFDFYLRSRMEKTR